MRIYLHPPSFLDILYAAVHGTAMGGPDVEYAAVAVNSPYDTLRKGTAVGTEDSDMETVGVQETKSSFESIRLMEFHWGVPITVLDVGDDTIFINSSFSFELALNSYVFPEEEP